MKRDTKILLIIVVVAFLLVTAMPKVEDIYRTSVAKKVIGKWRTLADQYASYWKVDPQIVLAIICQESGGNPDSVNPSDPSRGLMQITPGALADFNQANGRGYTFDELFEPYKNVEVGTWYYSSRFAKTLIQKNALAAYNAGLGNIKAGMSYADKVETYLTYIKANYGSV